jgi:hypothetical protein
VSGDVRVLVNGVETIRDGQRAGRDIGKTGTS